MKSLALRADGIAHLTWLLDRRLSSCFASFSGRVCCCNVIWSAVVFSRYVLASGKLKPEASFTLLEGGQNLSSLPRPREGCEGGGVQREAGWRRKSAGFDLGRDSDPDWGLWEVGERAIVSPCFRALGAPPLVLSAASTLPCKKYVSSVVLCRLRKRTEARWI